MTPVPFLFLVSYSRPTQGRLPTNLGLNLKALNISTAGMRKARVFPDPVFAAPRTSLPANNGGIPLCCISVIWSNFISSIACIVLLDRLRSANRFGSIPVAGNDSVVVDAIPWTAVYSSSRGATFSVSFCALSCCAGALSMASSCSSSPSVTDDNTFCSDCIKPLWSCLLFLDFL